MNKKSYAYSPTQLLAIYKYSKNKNNAQGTKGCSGSACQRCPLLNTPICNSGATTARLNRNMMTSEGIQLVCEDYVLYQRELFTIEFLTEVML